MRNSLTYKVYGRYALFTDPLTRIGGEKYTYPIPTYQSLKGITESIYWKPTIIWKIDRIRIMKAIRTESKNMRPIMYHKAANSLSIYTYLKDVEYQVEVHFEWNLNREEMKEDRNENKHFFVAKRMLERGGRRDIFLGTRECQGYVEPCEFGEGTGFYDNYGDMNFNMMFHGFDYPDETGKNQLAARIWNAEMKNGVIEFVKPEECLIRKEIRKMHLKDIQSIGLKEDELLDHYEEYGELL